MTLRRELADGVLTLTLDRPKVKNALDADLTEALLSALADARSDGAVRCVVLTGAGDAFSSGGDLHGMVERRGNPVATKDRQERGFGALVRSVLTLPKPVVAKVNGAAYGAGAMLALAADLTYASDGATFGFAFSRVGLIPDTGGTFLLPRLVGLKRAKELVLLSEVVDAPRALHMGLVNDVVPAVELDARVAEVARRLADGPTAALALAKQALLAGAVGTLDEALANEANLQGVCFTLEDHAEGVDAVLEKRKPHFTGR